MTRALIIEPEAEVEIVEAADWYEMRSPGRGLIFLRSVDVSLEIIRANPYEYQPIFRNVHRAPTRRFPYGLMYTATDDEVIVIACIHGRRHPNRWKGRAFD
jgi:toxin ParE1/3/4